MTQGSVKTALAVAILTALFGAALVSVTVAERSGVSGARAALAWRRAHHDDLMG
jgi:hypothetical protein